MSQLGYVPSEATLASLLKALSIRENDLQQVIKRYLKKGAMSTETEEKIASWKEENNLNTAWEILISTEKHFTYKQGVYDGLLRNFAHQGDIKRGAEILHKINDLPHLKPSAMTYASLILLYSEAKDFSSSMKYFEKFRSQLGSFLNDQRNLQSVYSIAIISCLENGEFDRAEKILERTMLEDDIIPDVLTYNSIITHLVNNGKFDEALEWFTRLKKAQVGRPNEVTYNVLLSSACDAERFDNAKKIYKDKRAMSVSSRYSVLETLAKLSLKNRDVQLWVEVLQEMKDLGFKPRMEFCRRSMEALFEFEDSSRNVEAFETLILLLSKESKSRREALDFATYVLQSQKSDSKFVLKSLKTLLKYEIRPNDHISAVVVDSYKHTADPHVTADVYGYIAASYIIASNRDPESLKEIEVLASQSSRYIDGTGLDNLYQSIGDALFGSKSSGVKTLWKQELLSCQHSSISERVLHALKKAELSSKLSHNIIEKCGESKGLPVAESLLEDAVNSQVLLTPQAFSELIERLGIENRLEDAEKILKISDSIYQNIKDPKERNKARLFPTNSLLCAFASRKNLPKAQEYYESIVNMGEYPSANACAQYLFLLHSPDASKIALDAYEELRIRGLRLTHDFFRALWSKIAYSADLSTMADIYLEMKHYQIQPTELTYNTLINTSLNMHNSTSAHQYYREMLQDTGCKLSPIPFNTMMTYYINQRDQVKVAECFKDLQASKVTPNGYTYKLLLQAYAFLEPFDISKCQEILSGITHPEPYHYNLVIASAGRMQKDPQLVEQIFKEMLERKVVANESTYRTLAQVYESFGDQERYDEVRKHLKHLEANLS
ncbi:hypothetical protein K493DRAFT_344116 [Basidiobolus meristosporus CBS 931.73]|uniref:TPR-like protein n=1 Tax=Basidiobolus meristosporus CBS 931.73 TaxID=1314790 RepID=A0A1Y1ZAJ3_9FUNG|nr:hypothetical protein K493DRAFT_344116 [Basidiobolus meristosporus CBS 931.73]|eukprot:ORY07196.1 hypothetical protein K493DRAFT_344116 [Basidiobolus meristosporus CBS 931.73]